MTEIEEMAIYKRKFEIEEEKKQEKETMQRELQDYVDGKIKYNELSGRARFFLLQNTVEVPDFIKIHK